MLDLSHETRTIISRNDVAWQAAEQTKTVPEYVDDVINGARRDPSPAAYVLAAIRARGTERDPSGRMHYKAFDGVLGVDGVVEAVVGWLERETTGTEAGTGAKALVIAGPPGPPGRETVDRIVEAVRDFSGTLDGALDRIAGCPRSDDPLHLLEPSLEMRLVEEGVIPAVRGSLCGECTRRWGAMLDDEVDDIRVERYRLGVDGGVALIRGADATVPEIERAAAQANRGVLVVRDLGHMGAGPLHALIDVVSTGSSLVIADADIATIDELGRTPETAVCRMSMHVISLRHSLVWTEERHVFERYVRAHMSSGSQVHVSPLAPEAMAKVAVLSRLEEPQVEQAKYDRWGKVALYEEADSVSAMQELATCIGEGLSGVPSAAALNALADCTVVPGVACVSVHLVLDRVSKITGIDPLDVLKVVEDGLERARQIVRQASVAAFETEAKRKFETYLDNVTPPFYSEVLLPNHEVVMRRIEGQDVRDPDREAVRQYYRENPGAGWRDHPTMRASIERPLLPPIKDVRKRLAEPYAGQDRTDWAALRRTTHAQMLDTYDFCDVCAVDMVRLVLWNKRPVSVNKGSLDWQWPRNMAKGDALAEVETFRAS